MSWHFNKMGPGDLNVDPVEHEFFATETLDGITEALVREAIQNSLDAAIEEKVRVRFRLGRADATERLRYLDNLWPHAAAAQVPNAIPPNRHDSFRFLAVEDEDTRGLEGDPGQYEDDEWSGERNDFYYFWRNVGRSRKESTERGRWGLGKTVFAAASRLSGFFGLTKRHSDGRLLLMGQAVLKIHKIGTERYRPYGYFGRHDERGFTRPIEDHGICYEFIRRFQLQRNGPGLSIVIPYPDEEITAEGLLASALRHYFHPLLAGKLEVEVAGENGTCLVLHQQGLAQAIKRQERLTHMLPLIQLASWGMNPDAEAVARLRAPNTGRAPKLTEDLFDAADLERLRRRYDDGRRIALEVPLSIELAEGTVNKTKCRLLLERDGRNQRGEGYFVRQGITIDNPKARRPRGIRWILEAEDANLSAFLGDAENPAHTEWQRSSSRIKTKYKRGSSTIDFLRSLPANVASLLSGPAGRRDPDLLRHIFSLSGDGALPSPQRPEPKPEGSQQSTSAESIPETLGKNGALVLQRVNTGFRLSGRVDGEAPQRLEVLAAYDVLRGDPFARYSPLDFCMDKSIAVRVDGARIVARHENRLVIAIEVPEFNVLVTRFDKNRDLRVKVRSLEEEER